MAKKRRIRWDRVAMVFVPLLLLILILCISCNHKTPSEQNDSSSQVDSDASQVASITDLTGSETDTMGTETTTAPLPTEYVLVLDAGHGGDDGGATNGALTRFEKDDNLRLTLAVRDALKKYPQVRVIMTREDDTFVRLKDRCSIANTSGADFFLSLHRNAAMSGSGIEIWINNDTDAPNSTDRMMAEYIMELLEDVGISKNRGIKGGFRNSFTNDESDNYYVNRYTDMPSCLVEMGFMTSDTDNEYFDTRLEAYADAIATAVVEYITDKRLVAVPNEN